MRVLTRPTGPRKDHRHAEGEEAHAGADRPAPTQRRSRPRRRPHNRPDLPGDRRQRTDLLPLEEPLRGHEDPGVAAPERARAGEPAPEETGGRPLLGQCHVEGAGRGKLLSPTTSPGSSPAWRCSYVDTPVTATAAWEISWSGRASARTPSASTDAGSDKATGCPASSTSAAAWAQARTLATATAGAREPHLSARFHLRPERRRPFLEVAFYGR